MQIGQVALMTDEAPVEQHSIWVRVLLELLHTHLGFLFPKFFICLLVIISHYPVSYILGENIPPGEYSLSVHTSV
jgi:hypothetical protein